MKPEILVKLKSAEEETARRLEKARERAAETARDGRLQAEELLRVAAEDAQKDQEAQLATERARLEQERERILSEGRTKEDHLRAAYKKNADPYLKKALDTFSRSLNA